MEHVRVPMISLRGVGKSYGAHQVLFDFDLDVMPGEVISLIGPSGSGKTTALRCMNFLETYQQGELRIRGALLGYDIAADGRRTPASERSIACGCTASARAMPTRCCCPPLSCCG